MMTAKTKKEFNGSLGRLQVKYWNYTKTSKANLPKFNVDGTFLPDPRKYHGTHRQQLPMPRQSIAKERILEFEHYMKTLNMFMCYQCRECHIESRGVTDQLMYEFKSYKTVVIPIITFRIIFIPLGIW